ncbi:MAG TPA: phosphatidylserine/phosphatidylglycerophosphate/cardiolipin synthase family protein [Longimicrobiaceae bacterium]|nr:phosphatidylserine/phosphatidylglycerophosphate/cardiolipin synthase family protein [Longimicrobiaceae bacterium]
MLSRSLASPPTLPGTMPVLTPDASTHPILTPELESECDALTDTTVREGNSVTLLPSGLESYRLRWELLEKARHSIHVVAFSIMRDETSAYLRDLICRKAREGVRVRMIFDDGVLLSTFAGGLLRDMERAGAEVIRYHRMSRDWIPDLRRGHPLRQVARTAKLKLRRHFHEKYLVVDGREAILGGINWGNKYAHGGRDPKAWRDSDVYLTGPVVGDIQRRFLHDFFLYQAMEAEHSARRQPGFDRERHYREFREREEILLREEGADYLPPLPVTGTERIRYIPHKPFDEERLRLTEALLQLFREARRYIYWGCHGIRPPRILGETLAAAAQRGVEVRLITNSSHASRTLMAYGLLGWMYWESSNHFPWLLRNGVRVFEWQKPGAFHSKNLVIDDVVASVGSYNIARGSAFHHTESNVVVYGGEFPLAVRRQFEVDFADCREVTPDTARPVSARHDPFLRPLSERDLLVRPSLRTEAIQRDLDAGRYKRL